MSGLWARFIARHRRLDEQVAAARERAEQAQEEVRRSQERAALVHTEVVAPLQARAAHNQFADLIRASLVEGRRGR